MGREAAVSTWHINQEGSAMATPVPWSIVFPPPNPLRWIGTPPEDIITLTQQRGATDPGSIQFVLGSSNPRITWWKQLRIVGDGERLVLGSSEFQDELRRGAIIELALPQLSGRAMQLCKAKTFGVHTCMYELSFDAAPPGLLIPGALLSFDWFCDDGPGNRGC